MKNTVLITLCTLSLGAASASAQLSVDNSLILDSLRTFGYPNTATYGQSFTAPADNVLDDWTFYLAYAGGPPANFEFFVMSWNGSSANGTVLYQSGLETAVPGSGYAAFTVAPDLTLTTGNQYVMFINESGLNDNNGDNYSQVFQGGNVTSPLGGSFVFLNNADDFSEVTSETWFTVSGLDTAYKADFSASTAPDAGSSMLLISLSLGSIAATCRFAKSKSVNPLSLDNPLVHQRVFCPPIALHHG